MNKNGKENARRRKEEKIAKDPCREHGQNISCCETMKAGSILALGAATAASRGHGDRDSCRSMHTASHVGNSSSRWGKDQMTNANCASRPDLSEEKSKE